MSDAAAERRILEAGGGAVNPKGGGGGHHVTVAGIENAPELRDLISSHLRRLGAGAGLGDPEDEQTRGHAPHGLSTRALAALEDVAAAASALSKTTRGLA